MDENNFLFEYKTLYEKDKTLTSLFRMAYKTSLLSFSYVSRWASLRGTLPQPMVVFFLATAALTAPRRRKIIAVALTLICLRTVAEAMHGYVYGDEDWEDDALYADDHDDDNDDDDDDDDDDDYENHKRK